MDKILSLYEEEKVDAASFHGVDGYGHGDIGREKLDVILAKLMGAEEAAVRLQFVSGTHAITAALFGVLRPGDRLLSITGRPYDTLEEVIGLRGSGQGSLAEFGIHYDELALTPSGDVDESALADALSVPTRMVCVTCNTSWPDWWPMLESRQWGYGVRE